MTIQDYQNSNDINFQLYKFYKSIENELIEINHKFKKCTTAHLLMIRNDCLKMKNPLMIVGQQTCGWGNIYQFSKEYDYTYNSMQLYYDFNLAENYHNSPFWAANRLLQKSINNMHSNFYWSNIIKVDENYSRPNSIIEEKILSLNILENEIKILKPKIIIFFIGTSYDNALQKSFMNYKSEDTGNKVYKIIHEMLPKHSYKTYHPNYLRRQNLTNVTINHIFQLINDSNF